MIERFACLFALLSSLCGTECLTAQSVIEADPSEVEVHVDGSAVTIKVPPGVSTLTIPNLHAPMVSLKWAEESADHDQLKLRPLVDRWEFQVPIAESSQHLHLLLEDPAQVTATLKPIGAAADGGFTIGADAAHVVGEKLRYEPQPWKNTVGYWANVDDYMYFLIRCNRAGTWNVGVLQGCGKGHGGSDAMLSLHGPLLDLSRFALDQAPLESAPTSVIDFKAQETGHFQNFIWRHVGEIGAPEPGVYALKISAQKIARGAVMDVRSVALTRLPE